MTYGSHYEWRGFGSVSRAFNDKYTMLPIVFPSAEVIDEYIWVPGLNTNIKLRTGAEGGFKFKRLLVHDPPLQKWMEDENEIYFFPLKAGAWEKLRIELQKVKIILQDFPTEPITRKSFLPRLEKSGCRIVTIKKLRESRIFKTIHGSIKIERAMLSAPEDCISIGLENWESTAGNDELLKEDMHFAIREFGLEQEDLEVMSYLDAIKKWIQT